MEKSKKEIYADLIDFLNKNNPEFIYLYRWVIVQSAEFGYNTYARLNSSGLYIHGQFIDGEFIEMTEDHLTQWKLLSYSFDIADKLSEIKLQLSDGQQDTFYPVAVISDQQYFAEQREIEKKQKIGKNLLIACPIIALVFLWKWFDNGDGFWLWCILAAAITFFFGVIQNNPQKNSSLNKSYNRRCINPSEYMDINSKTSQHDNIPQKDDSKSSQLDETSDTSRNNSNSLSYNK